MADVIKSTGKQLKLDNSVIDRLRFNAWDDKEENKPYLHVEGKQGLGAGLAAGYDAYSKPVSDNRMSDMFQQGNITKSFDNGLAISGMVDKYGNYPSRHGVKGSYKMGDGWEVEVSKMDDEAKATLYKYMTNGRFKLEGSKKDNEDAKLQLLYNQRF